MHPYQWIVRTNRQPDGLSARPDEPNTLTCKYAATQNAPRDPRCGPVKWNPVYTWTYLPCLNLSHWKLLQFHDRWKHATTALIAHPLTHHLSNLSAVIGIRIFVLITISDLIWLTVSNLTRLSFSELIQLSLYAFIFD